MTDPDTDKDLNRRKFIRSGLWGSMLVTLGGLIGWTASRHKMLFPGSRKSPRVLDAKYTYDLSEIKKTDPSLLLYKPTTDIPTDLQRARRLVVTADDRILVAGDNSIKRLERDGAIQQTIPLPGTPTCLAVAPDGRLYVGLRDHVASFDAQGKPLKSWETLGEKSYLTSITMTEEVVFLADAGNREVLRCDHDGKLLGRFGKKDEATGNPGFVVPSPYFDMMIGKDGLLRVANPGRHRIELYTLDGHFEAGWGKASYAVDGFCGCCNPVYFKLLSDGQYLTSEKGLTRVKIYAADGTFRGVVAGPEHLVDDLELAEMAADDCQIGCGYDVAVDSTGAILILDPKRQVIRVFTALT